VWALRNFLPVQVSKLWWRKASEAPYNEFQRRIMDIICGFDDMTAINLYQQCNKYSQRDLIRLTTRSRDKQPKRCKAQAMKLQQSSQKEREKRCTVIYR
jgi:hypothetical protein